MCNFYFAVDCENDDIGSFCLFRFWVFGPEWSERWHRSSLSPWTHSSLSLKTCCVHKMRMCLSRLDVGITRCTLATFTRSTHCRPVTARLCPRRCRACARWGKTTALIIRKLVKFSKWLDVCGDDISHFWFALWRQLALLSSEIALACNVSRGFLSH